MVFRWSHSETCWLSLSREIYSRIQEHMKSTQLYFYRQICMGYYDECGLNKLLLKGLFQSQYIDCHQSIVLQKTTGSGKNILRVYLQSSSVLDKSKTELYVCLIFLWNMGTTPSFRQRQLLTTMCIRPLGLKGVLWTCVNTVKKIYSTDIRWSWKANRWFATRNRWAKPSLVQVLLMRNNYFEIR